MKIRSGFVSNSSSASYSVTIVGVEWESLVNVLLQEYGWDLLNAGSTLRDLRERLTELEQEDVEMSEGISVILSEMNEQWMTNLQNQILSLENAEDQYDLVERILNINGVTVFKTDDQISFTGVSTCHNDYRDMPLLLQQIVLCISFETPCRVICEVSHDS